MNVQQQMETVHKYASTPLEATCALAELDISLMQIGKLAMVNPDERNLIIEVLKTLILAHF